MAGTPVARYHPAMIRVLSHPVYRRLFSAQVVALLGTGLLTVALSLLAYDLAGAQAGAVLGTVYAIKMVAYVGLSPVTGALAERLPRKKVLIGADLIRAVVALALPFVDAIWQVYVLIFLLQAASATFTPAFQATIPDILPEEEDYTRALSLSRLAYDLENLLSPALAGLLLVVLSYQSLFLGTVAGFLGSALLVWASPLARRALPGEEGGAARRGFRERLTRGARIYLATPRLRGLLSFNLAAAAAGAFVLVNTVVIVRGGDTAAGAAAQGIDRGETGVAVAMAAFGAGSMLAALALPRLLSKLGDRPVMSAAAGVLAMLTLGYGLRGSFGGQPLPWVALLGLWAALGVAYGAVLTPSGRLLRRSSHPEDRQAVFTAQFALSHACWLVTYPVAGWVGQAAGLGQAALILGLLALAGTFAGLRLWPAGDPEVLRHAHPDLPPDHPHLAAPAGDTASPTAAPAGGAQAPGGAAPVHAHAFVIDDEHHAWPTHG